MTDEHAPDSASRRARLATRKKRVRILGVAVVVALLVIGFSTATALRNNDAAPTTPGKHAAGGDLGPATAPNLGVASKLKPPRALSHSDPMKLWIGGDSLAGTFGPALGQMGGATGIVNATIDYKVSSGLADQGIRNWYEHAQQSMASENPDAVVFIIGTNDASIVNSQDSNHDGVPDWEVGYRAKIDRMMQTFVGGTRHRTVFWLGPPTLSDSNLDKGAKGLGPVMRDEAKKFAPDVVYIDTYRLFSDSNGEYSASLPDANGKLVDMRISDGVHFSIDGAKYLSEIVWKLLDKRWDISSQADPSQPIDYTIAQGSNDYVPGVGHYRPKVNYSSPSTTPSSSVTATTGGTHSPTTTPGTTKPTTPPTKPPGTTPSTKPPGTTPPTSPPTSPPTT